MSEFLEILKYILPSVVVFFTAYYLLRMFLSRDEESKRHEITMLNSKIITPIRLQAYERVTLFLERISPESLIVRVQRSQMTAKNLQSALLSAIREEFEHNLSQQIYMTPDAWEVIINTKENIVQLINVAASKLKQEATSIELSHTIIEMYLRAEEPPIRKALNFIKEETSNFLNTKPIYYAERI